MITLISIAVYKESGTANINNGVTTNQNRREFTMKFTNNHRFVLVLMATFSITVMFALSGCGSSTSPIEEVPLTENIGCTFEEISLVNGVEYTFSEEFENLNTITKIDLSELYDFVKMLDQKEINSIFMGLRETSPTDNFSEQFDDFEIIVVDPADMDRVCGDDDWTTFPTRFQYCADSGTTLYYYRDSDGKVSVCADGDVCDLTWGQQVNLYLYAAGTGNIPSS